MKRLDSRDWGARGGRDSYESNLMDEDSSTYCTPHTRRSISVSQLTEPKCAAQSRCDDQEDLNFPGNAVFDTLSVDAATGNRGNRLRQPSQKNEGHLMHTVENEVPYLQDCTSSQPVDPEAFNVCHLNGAANNTGDPSASAGAGAAEEANSAFAFLGGDNDDDDSSVKFVVEKTVSAGRTASSSSSIEFVLESSSPPTVNGAIEDFCRNNGQCFDSSATSIAFVEGSSTSESRSRANRKEGMRVVDGGASGKIDRWRTEYGGPSFPKCMRNAASPRYINDDNNKVGSSLEWQLQDRGGVNMLDRGESRWRAARGAGEKSHQRRSSTNSRASLPFSQETDYMGRGRRRSNQRSGGSSARQISPRSFVDERRRGTHSQRSSNNVSTSFTSVGRKGPNFSSRRASVSPRRSRDAQLSTTSRSRNGGATAVHHEYRTPLCSTQSLSPVLDRSRQHPLLDSPQRWRYVPREELLETIDDEIEAVREEIRAIDVEMERRMQRDPFERLYHMNNRRDRDERRCRILHYVSLEEAKRLLLAQDAEGENGELEWDRRRAERRESARRRAEMFERLYRETPARLRNDNKSTTPSPRISSHILDDSIFERLYKDGLELKAERRERVRQAATERMQKEVESLLHSRILARLEKEAPPHRMRTPQQKEALAARIQRALIQDAQRLREYLKAKRLKKGDQEELSCRLMQHGYVSAEKLAKKKDEMELAKCTFQPKINSPRRRRSAAASLSYTRATALSACRQKRESPGAASPDVSPSRPSSRRQKLVCEELYKRAKGRCQQQKALADEVNRQKKLSLLKSKLKEDHHFRRRVELDPSLAERYMASLLV